MQLLVQFYLSVENQKSSLDDSRNLEFCLGEQNCYRTPARKSL